MTRVEEAVLAFIGTSECERKPWKVSEHNTDAKVRALLSEGMIEIEDDAYVVSVRGWHFLDTRPRWRKMESVP